MNQTINKNNKKVRCVNGNAEHFKMKPMQASQQEYKNIYNEETISKILEAELRVSSHSSFYSTEKKKHK